MNEQLINISNLKTIANLAREYGYSPVHIYELARKNHLKLVEVDGVKFIDISAITESTLKKKR